MTHAHVDTKARVAVCSYNALLCQLEHCMYCMLGIWNSEAGEGRLLGGQQAWRKTKLHMGLLVSHASIHVPKLWTGTGILGPRYMDTDGNHSRV